MSVSSLEVHCLLVLGEHADRLDPNIFSGIPRHLLVEISKCLNPFDLERLENGTLFEKAGISTESLWKERYHRRWICTPLRHRRAVEYRNLHAPEGILREECRDCDSWKAAYLGRHLQVILNERGWPLADSQEEYLSPLLNRNAYQRIWSLENTLDICSKYGACLSLSNRACIYLAENPSVFFRFAKYVKFLRVNFIQKSGIASLCSLLETLTAMNLVGLEFFHCKHVDPQSWSKIFAARSPDSKCKQLSSLPVIHNKGLATTCGCQDSQCTKSCGTSSDTGSSHSCCTSSQISTLNRGSTSLCQDTILSLEETESSLDMKKQVESNSQDIHLYDFDADMEMCAGQVASQSTITDSCSSSDLYDEVFACSRITEGTACKFLCGSSALGTATSGSATEHKNGSAQMETLPKPYTYTGIASTKTLFSCLRHLEYSSDCIGPTGSSLALLLEILKKCRSLESLIVVFSQPCTWKEAEALVTAMCDLCSKGRLRHVELRDLNLPVLPVTDNFIKLLWQVVGANCTVCQLDVPASLKSLCLRYHSLNPTGISAEDFCHFAERLANFCSCSRKGESGKAASVQLVDSTAQVDKVHKTALENPSVCTESVLESSKEKGLPKDTSGKPNTRRSGSGEEITDLTGRCVSPVDVHVKQSVEAAMTFTGLQELELSSCHIGDSGAKAIAASLERNSTLFCLALSYCDISTPGMSAIFKAVTGNRTLRTLNLSMNCYSPLTDNSLATMLRTSQGLLSELDMSHCFLDEGLNQDIISSLCQNNSLKCLKLNENRLGDSGVEMLAEVFRKPESESTITRLELSSNLVTSSSVMALVTALHSFKPRKLEELLLVGNCFGSNINKAQAYLQCIVSSVYVSNEDSALAHADYVSQM